MEEEEVQPKKRKSPILSVVLASFILGSFSGAAFGVVFALSLEKDPAARQLLLDAPTRVVTEERVMLAEDIEVIKAVKSVSPSVVSITVTKDVAPFFTGTAEPFDIFFGLPDEDGNTTPLRKRQVGGGTGFIISEDGLILTNRHVVSDVDASYEVLMSDGSSYEAKVLARDLILDVAVLKVEAEGLVVANLGSSAKVEIGETVIAIGDALSEYQNTVTKGVISGIGRRVIAADGFGSSEVIEEALQTDAAINPGNSGGPLIDIGGKVIGVNTAVNRSGQSIGFAIPIDAVKLVIDSVREHGRIVRPWLGVRYILIDAEYAEENGIRVDYGALVVSGPAPGQVAVVADSPAEVAGIQENDILLEINGKKITMTQPLSRVISSHQSGELVMITLLRGEEYISFQTKLGEIPGIN